MHRNYDFFSFLSRIILYRSVMGMQRIAMMDLLYSILHGDGFSAYRHCNFMLLLCHLCDLDDIV